MVGTGLLAMGSLSAIQRVRELMRVLLRNVLCVVVGLMGVAVLEAGDFRVHPYLQNPASDAMSVRWLSNSNAPGTLKLAGGCEYTSKPVLATALAYNPFKPEPGGPHNSINKLG